MSTKLGSPTLTLQNGFQYRHAEKHTAALEVTAAWKTPVRTPSGQIT